ncbi:MAG: hypothetical protein HQL60_07530, partial [Magnetococcales bacterium]|nr:hypothetical protein [Magnetococcales bacterium]
MTTDHPHPSTDLVRNDRPPTDRNNLKTAPTAEKPLTERLKRRLNGQSLDDV